MVGAMSITVPTSTISSMITSSSRVGLSMNGSSSSLSWPGRSAMLTSQAETMAAATRNITTDVVLAAPRITS
ncbi:hypothetical protein D3C86_1965810 [compost metagenome]